MDTTDDEPTFLRDLVKVARQKPHHVEWVDRDGSKRHTLLAAAELSRLEAIAHRRKVSLGEVLRQAAHTPVEKRKPTATSTVASSPDV